MGDVTEPQNEQFAGAASQQDGIGIRNAIAADESGTANYLPTLNNLIATSSSLYFLYQMSFLFADHFTERNEDRKKIIKRMIEFCDTLDDVEKTLDVAEKLANLEDRENLINAAKAKSALLYRLKREREKTHKQLCRYMSIKTIHQYKTLESLRVAIKTGKVEILTSQDGVVDALHAFCDDIGAHFAVEETDDDIEPYRKALGEKPKKVTMWM